MKVFSTLVVAGCLVCAAPLVQACDVRHRGMGEGKCVHEVDKNGDGVITKKEFDAFHNERFKELDANKDGKVTQEEMDGMHQKMMENVKSRVESRFDESDINHDGMLSKDEAEIGMPMLFGHFDESDTNKDGKVSKEELATSMKQMREQMRDGKGMKRGQP